MKISRAWLQTFFDAPLPDAVALSDALTFHVFEIDGIDHVGHPMSYIEDDVLDVKVTANRGHDCLSYIGIAREISAILQLPLKSDPLRTPPVLEPKNDSVRVTISDSNLCPRFTTALITGVKVGPSPEWLVERLDAMGQRSINNVVDATNFVMFGLGQPLHAFDAGKLAVKDGSYALNVRTAKPDESMIGLDDKSYVLTPAMLVIADGNSNDSAVSIAGIKGGKPTGIDEATTSVILEAANWNGANIRKTSQALKLRTDASSRFEQVISPELASYGLAATVELVRQIACPERLAPSQVEGGRGAGGTVSGYGDVYPSPSANIPVAISTSRINAILGSSLSDAEVADAFKRLGLPFTQEGETFAVTPPFERLDILIPEDLIEEVGRIIGYDKIANVELPPLSARPEVNPNFYAAEKMREELISQGYSEVFTSAFADAGERVIANKIDGVRPYLRDSLEPGLAAAYEKNKPNKDILGLKQIKLFEIGTIWKDGKETVMIATAVKEKAGLKVEEKPLTPVAAETYDVLPLSETQRYQTFSRFPYIVRDIAAWYPIGTEPAEVLKLISDKAGPLLVRSDLFDRFEKGERVSLGFRLIFQSFEKTLTDVEVGAIMETVSAALKEKGFEIR